MTNSEAEITARLAEAAQRLQGERTGRVPSKVNVVSVDDTLVFILHEALSPAERILVQCPEGAARVQEYHRRLFEAENTELRREIKRITGREVSTATAEIETTLDSAIQVYGHGTMVQVFLLAPRSASPQADDPSVYPTSSIDSML